MLLSLVTELVMVMIDYCLCASDNTGGNKLDTMI